MLIKIYCRVRNRKDLREIPRHWVLEREENNSRTPEMTHDLLIKVNYGTTLHARQDFVELSSLTNTIWNSDSRLDILLFSKIFVMPLLSVLFQELKKKKPRG